MLVYAIKRILLSIPILIGVAFIIFFIMDLTPGDPATLLLGPEANSEAIAQLNHELGYDRPFIERFFHYIYDFIFKFDMGKSYRSSSMVSVEVSRKIPYTTILAVTSMILSSCIGIPLGVLSAVKQYSLLDTIPTPIALFFAAVPSFWLGMMLMYIFSLKLGWFPSSGISTLKHYVLPMIAVGLPMAAQQLRFTRSSMLETIRQDYIRTARAKGAAERTVIWKHALKNALLPVITISGISFGSLLGGAVVTETLFGIPGIGTLVVTAVRMKDVPMVMGASIFMAAIYVVVMLIIDLVYGFIDPRIKAKYQR